MNPSRVFNGVKGLGITLVPGALLVGCAVLTVDVDVYKGALVNEEHVQLHQLVALSTAAKPMLVQLRDSIEWPSEEMPEATPDDKKTWYKPGYVEPPDQPNLVPPQMGWWCRRNHWFCSPDTMKYPFFRNVMAVRVNTVLGLYETLDEKGKIIDPTNRRAGLDTLVKRYLELSRKSDQNASSKLEKQDKERMVAEHQLIDTLVEFASKVLFLANHEGLASPPGTPGLILGGAEKLNRGLLGDFLTDYSMYGLLNSGLAEDRKRQYVRVLQAVGNSILFSANELRERDRYSDLSHGKAVAEVRAANSVYSPDPKKVLDDLLKELEREKLAFQTQLDDSKVRKAQMEERIGSSTPHKTGLRHDQEATLKELTDAGEVFKNYLNTLSIFEATHDVLMTQVSEENKTAWKAAWQTDVSTLDELFTGSDGLKTKLTAARNLLGTPAIKKRFDAAISYVESQEALKIFEDYRVTKGHTSKKRSDLFDEFIAHIHSLDTKHREQTKEYENERDRKAEALRAIEAEIKTLTEEVGRLAKRISDLPDKKNLFEAARTSIESVRSEVLKEAGANSHFILPASMYQLIDSHLEKAQATAQGDTKKRYQNAQAVLSTRTPPPGMPPLDPNNYKSPIEVMDTVIALLRHHQMEMMQRLGQDSDESKRATEAVGNAYQHRAGMIYIRPSSAYLRTSFPSTSLQEDPNLAWDNMLLKQGLRNLPFSSELRDILDPTVKQDRSLTSELDKQYWQNINRVRVSGAGFTNQALVKDDVGNWYVKQYYGDTEDIAKSAKNLALFSLGTKMPIDLARELSDGSDQKGDSENLKSLPTLQKVLEKHRDANKTHTNEVHAKLERLHTKEGKSELQESIIVAWDGVDGIKTNSSFRTSLHEALRAEIREWDKAALALKSKVDQDRGQAIVKDVRALSRLDKMLSARIGELQHPELLKANAVSAVHRIVGGQAFDILADRNRALDQYEQAITFIGDAANPKETKKSN